MIEVVLIILACVVLGLGLAWVDADMRRDEDEGQDR